MNHDSDDRHDGGGMLPVSLSCEDAERWLTRLRVGDAASELPALLARHVEQCPHCRQEVDGYALLPVSLEESPRARAEQSGSDPLFVQAVLGRVRDEPAPVRRRERRLTRWRAAALVLVALGLALMLREVVTLPGPPDAGEGVVNGSDSSGVDSRASTDTGGDPAAWIPAPELPTASQLSTLDLVPFERHGLCEFIDPRPANCKMIEPTRLDEPPASPEEGVML